MNIKVFDREIFSIEKNIALTYSNLESNQVFPNRVRNKFNGALEALLILLNKDFEHQRICAVPWHTANRIVKFQKLADKIEEIRKKILRYSSKPYFNHKIRSKVIPLLNTRIKELKDVIGSKERLPLSISDQRDRSYNLVKQELQPTSLEKIKKVQIESFHLLANCLDPEELKKIDFSSYEGSLEVYSLESWRQILELCIQKGELLDNKIGDFLLSVIKKSIPLSIKTSFFYNLESKTRFEETKKELNYFEDLVKLNKPLVNGRLILSSSQFSEKYCLTDKSSIPESVLINEMTWDMLNKITKMEKGETQLFLLGTYSHSVAVEIFCKLDLDSSSKSKIYQYKIFNTGFGLTPHHQLDKTRKFAHPLVFNVVPEKAFTYLFIQELVRMSLQKEDIHEFYKLHEDVLVKQFGAKKQLMENPIYPIQKYGVCSYTAVEVWIKSYLNENQIKNLDLIKTKKVIDKQEMIIELINNKTKKTYAEVLKNIDSSNTAHKKKYLNDAEVLLTLSKKYLDTSFS